jgi:hypothetical protein
MDAILRLVMEHDLEPGQVRRILLRAPSSPTNSWEASPFRG